jgi:hypothetical protein
VDGDSCIFVGDSWNLRARLLELAAALVDVSHLTIVYELCPDDDRPARKGALTAELLGNASENHLPLPELPAILISPPFDR